MSWVPMFLRVALGDPAKCCSIHAGYRVFAIASGGTSRFVVHEIGDGVRGDEPQTITPIGG